MATESAVADATAAAENQLSAAADNGLLIGPDVYPVILRAGESVLGPRGIPHGFAGVGEKPAHMLIAFSPAGMMEQFFREVAVPNGPKMDAALFSRFEMNTWGRRWWWGEKRNLSGSTFLLR